MISWRENGNYQAIWKLTEYSMRNKNQSHSLLKQSRPRSTMATCPIDSLKNGCAKWMTRVTNTMKWPTQGTTIIMWNVHTCYAFRKRVDRHGNARTPMRHCQQLILEDVVCFFFSPVPQPPTKLKQFRDIMMMIILIMIMMIFPLYYAWSSAGWVTVIGIYVKLVS